MDETSKGRQEQNRLDRKPKQVQVQTAKEERKGIEKNTGMKSRLQLEISSMLKPLAAVAGGQNGSCQAFVTTL